MMVLFASNSARIQGFWMARLAAGAIVVIARDGKFLYSTDAYNLDAQALSSAALLQTAQSNRCEACRRASLMVSLMTLFQIF